MVHITQIGAMSKGETPRTPEQRLTMEMTIRKALGPMISSHVESVTWRSNTLILHVADPIWRRQLQSDLARIRTCLAALLPRIKNLVLEP